MSLQVPTVQELRKMNKEELDSLAASIRTFLVEKVGEKGGHLASNLGTVELTLALFRVLNLPEDKVIFDVGHQYYTYKLLSGRQDGFDTLRDYNGMSGFPKCRESEYDSFDTGHSSTSISAGLGLARARDLRHEHHHIVSVIGDGSMTGGMALEALNDASQLKSNFIIILNDNDMSISRNVGGLSKYLTGLRAASGYNKAKRDVKTFLMKKPGIGNTFVNIIANIKDSLKELMVPNGMWFENMGITYLGTHDGHNVLELERVLRKAMALERCVLIHIKTTKGKGYQPAEEHPEAFHGVGPFDVETGRPKSKGAMDYTAVFGQKMLSGGEKYKNLAAVTAAMSLNIGLEPFRAKYPDRLFDVGIAEQHAVTLAAGLSKGGIHPVVAIYSSFLQRAYDQIVHDVCLQNLPVVFAIDRAGIVGRDGETHQGAFDIAFLSDIPNMTLMAPKNRDEFLDMLDFAFTYEAPIAIRYPRGAAYTGLSEYREPIRKGKAEVIHRGKEVCILSYGEMTSVSYEAMELLRKDGIDATLVNMRFAKPVDKALLLELMSSHRLFVTVEDGVLRGGLGEHCAAFLLEQGYQGKTELIGIPDRYVPQGEPKELFKELQMDAESIRERIRKGMA